MPTKEQDCGEWYNETVDKAQLCDKRYPIKGMNVWTPYGWKIMSQIDSFLRREMEATEHDEVSFPLLIPESEFKKEKDHIKGFDEEVYWVTHAGLNPLDIRLVLRPTSETAMYPMFSLWVRSHQDLPLKVFQIVNTFRYETKQTRAFMRVREIHFFESHTCHADREDAERQIKQDVEIVDAVCHDLCLPYSLLIRTDWDKFPGAYYTVGIDTVMPNGRTLQIGSAHYYSTNFSKPYNITYETESGEHVFAHQTTLGMTERRLGADIGGALEKASDRRVFVERSHQGLTGYHAGVGSASDFQATDMGQIEHRAGDDQEGFLGVGGGGEKHVERIGGIIVGGRGQSGVRREADLGRFGEFRGAGQEEPADLGAAQGVGQPAKDRHAQDGMQHQGQLAAGAVAVIHQKYDRRTTIHIRRAPLRKIRP